MSLKEILAEFDNPEKKDFDCDDVLSAIGKQLPKDKLSLPEVRSEILAMQFQDTTGRDVWNTYYGPIARGEENVTRKPVNSPDISWIKPQDIDYWTKRAQETDNPFMKMRYAGLVFDFQKTIIGKEADYKTIKLPYVRSIIKVVKEDYCANCHVAYVYIERALSCARGFKNKDLLADVKSAIQHLEELYGKDDAKPGCWKRGLELMMKYEDVFTAEEMLQKVQEHIDRLNRIEKQALDKENKTDAYAHWANAEVQLLCGYFAKHNQQAKVEELLCRLYEIYKAAKLVRGAMWYHGMLDQLQQLCREFHYEKLAKRLFVDIQDSGMEAMQSMGRIEVPVAIRNEDIQAYLNEFMRDSNQEVIGRYVVWNIPDLQKEKQEQEREAKESPLFDMMSTVVYDSFGSPIRKIGNKEEQSFAKFMYGMYRRMQISTIFMNFQKREMLKKNILTVDAIMQELEVSPFIDKGRLPIVKRGVESYIAGDYLVACHLLIPQFESAIRMLVRSLGGEILKQDKKPDDGNQYITLNGLLNSDVLRSSGLPDDVIVYFQNLFTDQFGWNLRNMVCHGLLTEGQFDEAKADRIVHAFMILGSLRLKSAEE